MAEALEPSEASCAYKSNVEQKCASHCLSFRSAYLACVQRTGEIDKLPEKEMLVKAEMNGIAVKGFDGVRGNEMFNAHCGGSGRRQRAAALVTSAVAVARHRCRRRRRRRRRRRLFSRLRFRAFVACVSV